MNDVNNVSSVDFRIVNNQRLELLKLLDNASAGWVEFMDSIGRYLGPVVSAAGKPKKADLEKTLVGALGFSGWREMIEAPREENGLGWKFGTYQQWRKAYSVLNQVSGLRQEQLTPAEILRFAEIVKKANDGKLPLDSVQWADLLLEAEVKKEVDKAEQVQTLKNELTELRAELDKQTAGSAVKSSKIDDLEAQNASLLASVSSFTTTLAEKDAEIKRLGIQSASNKREAESLARSLAESKLTVESLAEASKEAMAEYKKALTASQKALAASEKQNRKLKSATLLKRVFSWSKL